MFILLAFFPMKTAENCKKKQLKTVKNFDPCCKSVTKVQDLRNIQTAKKSESSKVQFDPVDEWRDKRDKHRRHKSTFNQVDRWVSAASSDKQQTMLYSKCSKGLCVEDVPLWWSFLSPSDPNYMQLHPLSHYLPLSPADIVKHGLHA